MGLFLGAVGHDISHTPSYEPSFPNGHQAQYNFKITPGAPHFRGALPTVRSACVFVDSAVFTRCVLLSSPAPGFCSLRCGLALLLHFCNVSMMSQRVCLSLTMVAMVNGTGSQGSPNSSTRAPLDDVKVRGRCRPHSGADSPALLTVCVQSGCY